MGASAASEPLPLARPAALRLLPGSVFRGAPPFGLAAWSEGASGVAMAPALPPDWPADGLGDVRALAAQLPDPDALPPSTLIVVLPHAGAPKGLLARVFGGKTPHASRAARGTALLLRGYVGIGGGIDPDSGLDLAWGFSPP